MAMMDMDPYALGPDVASDLNAAEGNCGTCRYWEAGGAGPQEMMDYGRCATISDGTNDEAFTVDGDKLCRANHGCSLWEAQDGGMGEGVPPAAVPPAGSPGGIV